MIEREDIVAAVVAAAGGELIGRVRLQKTVYLLEQLGFGTNLPFEYHHFGPYSSELDNAIADAKAFDLIREDYGARQSDGARFSIFKLVEGTKINPEIHAVLGSNRASELVHTFARTNVTVLELAATIHWLWRFEKSSDWRVEITRRKSKKVQGGRLERAVDLLRSLGLAPPPAPAHTTPVASQGATF